MQLGSTDWAPPNPNLLHVTKINPIYLRKVQNVLSFPFLGEALWPQVEYPLGTLCDSPNGAVVAMVKDVRGKAPRGVARICDK